MNNATTNNHSSDQRQANIIMLTLKALDIVTKALNMLYSEVNAAEPDSGTPAEVEPAEAPAGKDKPVATPEPTAVPEPMAQPKPVTEPKPAVQAANPASYRAETIRFNEQYLREHCELRYNTMLKTTEFRLLSEGTAGQWRTLTDRDLNGITVSQLLAGGQSWTYGMRLCIDSSRVADYDPVGDYLDHLPAWDGRDHISALAARLPTAFQGWPRLFRRWLLAMVAQVRGLSQDHGNALVPLLIGQQGTGKSTFCKMLLPRALRQYYMDDIKMDNAEQVERVLGRMWLVNIDEYDSKTGREQAKIKRLLTEHDVQVRRPRSDQYTLVHRRCSFIATTNERRPITDVTGSRRFLCVELSDAIDTASPVPHDQLFAQALSLLEQGEPFYLTRDEERTLEAHNRRYCRPLLLQDAVGRVLAPAPTAADTLLTTTDIRELLAAELRPQDMPSPRQLSAALQAAGLRQGAQQGRHGWYARQREAAEKKSGVSASSADTPA